MKISLKNLNRKVVWCGFTVPLWVKATGLALGLVICFMVIGVVVLGVVVYKKVQLYEIKIQKRNAAISNEVSVIVIDPFLDAAITQTNKVPLLTGTTVFQLTYGAPGPWIQGGTNAELAALNAAATNPAVTVTVNTDNEFDFYLNYGSWCFYTCSLTTNSACFYTNDDGSVDNYCLVTNDDGSVTDGSLEWVLNSTNVDSPPKGLVPLHTLVIERTTDFLQWTPIWTNTACPTNAAQFYLDTNAPLPNAFYRAVDVTGP